MSLEALVDQAVRENTAEEEARTLARRLARIEKEQRLLARLEGEAMMCVRLLVTKRNQLDEATLARVVGNLDAINTALASARAALQTQTSFQQLQQILVGRTYRL